MRPPVAYRPRAAYRPRGEGQRRGEGRVAGKAGRFAGKAALRGEGRRGPAAGPHGPPAVSGMGWLRAATWVAGRHALTGGMPSRDGTASRGGIAGPGRGASLGSHVVTGWHGRRRLAAGGIAAPGGTARVRPGLVTGTRRLGPRNSGSAGRPVLAPPALRSRGRCSRGWHSRGRYSRAPVLRGLPGAAAVRRSAGFPGCPGLLASRARDHPWARRAGRPASTRSSGSARAAGRNALRRRGRRDRCLRPGRQRGAGPGGAPAVCRALMTCRARGMPPVAGRRSLSGDPPYLQTAGTFRLSPIRAMAKTTRTTRPNATPAATSVHPQPGHIGRIMLGQKPHDHARGHQDGAEHDRHGSRDRQDDD